MVLIGAEDSPRSICVLWWWVGSDLRMFNRCDCVSIFFPMWRVIDSVSDELICLFVVS